MICYRQQKVSKIVSSSWTLQTCHIRSIWNRKSFRASIYGALQELEKDGVKNKLKTRFSFHIQLVSVFDTGCDDLSDDNSLKLRKEIWEKFSIRAATAHKIGAEVGSINFISHLENLHVFEAKAREAIRPQRRGKKQILPCVVVGEREAEI